MTEKSKRVNRKQEENSKKISKKPHQRKVYRSQAYDNGVTFRIVPHDARQFFDDWLFHSVLYSELLNHDSNTLKVWNYIYRRSLAFNREGYLHKLEHMANGVEGVSAFNIQSKTFHKALVFLQEKGLVFSERRNNAYYIWINFDVIGRYDLCSSTGYASKKFSKSRVSLWKYDHQIYDMSLLDQLGIYEICFKYMIGADMCFNLMNDEQFITYTDLCYLSDHRIYRLTDPYVKKGIDLRKAYIESGIHRRITQYRLPLDTLQYGCFKDNESMGLINSSKKITGSQWIEDSSTVSDLSTRLKEIMKREKSEKSKKKESKNGLTADLSLDNKDLDLDKGHVRRDIAIRLHDSFQKGCSQNKEVKEKHGGAKAIFHSFNGKGKDGSVNAFLKPFRYIRELGYSSDDIRWFYYMMGHRWGEITTGSWLSGYYTGIEETPNPSVLVPKNLVPFTEYFPGYKLERDRVLAKRERDRADLEYRAKLKIRRNEAIVVTDNHDYYDDMGYVPEYEGHVSDQQGINNLEYVEENDPFAEIEAENSFTKESTPIEEMALVQPVVKKSTPSTFKVGLRENPDEYNDEYKSAKKARRELEDIAKRFNYYNRLENRNSIQEASYQTYLKKYNEASEKVDEIGNKTDLEYKNYLRQKLGRI